MNALFLQLLFIAFFFCSLFIPNSLLDKDLLAQQEKPADARSTTSRLSSPFRRAIQRGLAPDGDIVKELREISLRVVTNRRDAEAVIDALATLIPEQLTQRRLENDNTSPLYSLAVWFESINYSNNAATDVFAQKGIPQLLKCYDSILKLDQPQNEKDLLYLLHLMVAYKSSESASRIIEAARKPIARHDYYWHTILNAVMDDYPEKARVLQGFTKSLPAEPIAAHLLAASNDLLERENQHKHPFDSLEGYKQLAAWLGNPDEVELAVAATSAIKFITKEHQPELLNLALKNPSKQIQIQAAMTAASQGYQFGLDALVNLCSDVGYYEDASQHLKSLGKAELIPKLVTEPSFLAKARLSQWLQKNSEHSDAPSDMEIIDERELHWPPSGDKQKFWLIRCRYPDAYKLSADDVYVGLVGRDINCILEFHLPNRPVEDIYALYVSAQMLELGLMEESKLVNQNDRDFWLAQWKGKMLTDVSIRCTVQVDYELDLNNYKIALATAKLDDTEGWIIFDGPRSKWYPKTEQPAYQSYNFGGIKSEIYMIHLGRQILGLPLDETDRLKNLTNSATQISLPEFIAAYDKLLVELPSQSLKRQQELFQFTGPITTHFTPYLDALVETGVSAKDEAYIALYERLLGIANKLEEPAKDEALGATSVLADHFLPYVKLLIARDREQDVIRLCQQFEPYWSRSYGWAMLGEVYYLAGSPEKAESFLTQFFEYQKGSSLYPKESGILAEIWKEKNEIAKSKKLLIDGMKNNQQRLIAFRILGPSSKEAKSYQLLYQEFLRLYPGAEKELKSAGLQPDPISGE